MRIEKEGKKITLNGESDLIITKRVDNYGLLLNGFDDHSVNISYFCIWNVLGLNFKGKLKLTMLALKRIWL